MKERRKWNSIVILVIHWSYEGIGGIHIGKGNGEEERGERRESGWMEPVRRDLCQ